MNNNAHGHKLQFPAYEKAQFVTALGINGLYHLHPLNHIIFAVLPEFLILFQ
jgi:hypothetical protein